MKTSSATIPFKVIRDSKGTSRRRYLRICLSCKKEEWCHVSWISNSQIRCKKCTSKDSPSIETRNKISATLRKTFSSPSYKELFGQHIIKQNRKGENHWNWKGGITSVNQQERNSAEALNWKRCVLRRDLYHCRMCLKNKDSLVAHHIKPYSAFPELRTVLSNGMTLCEDCHAIVHLYFKEVLCQSQ